MSDFPGFGGGQSVDLGSAHGAIIIDYSQVGQQFDRAIGSVERNVTQKLNDIGGRLQSFGARMTLVTAPITAFLTKGVLAFAEFDEVMREIEARTGATAEEMAAVRQRADEMGRVTAFSSTEAAQAMLELLSSGSNLQETFEALPAVLDLAAAGNIQLGESADAVTDILAQFQEDISRSRDVVDALARASGASSAKIPDLIQAFQNVGPVARAFGLSFDETAAVLAVFAENGIKGAEAGTQLRSMLNNMTRPTDDVKQLWDDLGISMTDAEGNFRDIDAVIKDLNVAMADMTPAERQEAIRTLGGSFGQMGLEALLATNGISDMEAAMAEAADASSIAEARMGGIRGTLRRLGSSLDAVSKQIIGPLVEDYLNPLGVELDRVLQRLVQWLEANPELASAIGLVLSVLVVLGPILIGIGTFLQVAAFAVSGLGIAFAALTSPIFLVIAAIAALVVAYKTNFMGFRDTANKVIEFVLEHIDLIAGAMVLLGGPITALIGSVILLYRAWQENFLGIQDFVAEAVDWVLDKLDDLFNWFVSDGLPWIEQAIRDAEVVWNAFQVGLGAIWEAVQPALQSMLDWFLSDGLPFILNAIDDAIFAARIIKNALKLIWDGAKDKLNDLWSWFQNTWPTVVSKINDAWDAAQSVKDALSNLWNDVRDGVQSFADGIERQLQPVVDFINGIKRAVDDVKNAVGSVSSGGGLNRRVEVGGVNLNPFARQHGGPVTSGRPYMVGEDGRPELFVPRNSGLVVSNDQLATAMNVLMGRVNRMAGAFASPMQSVAAGPSGGQGGGQVVNDFSGMVINVPPGAIRSGGDPEQAGRDIFEVFRDEVRRRGGGIVRP